MQKSSVTKRRICRPVYNPLKCDLLYVFMYMTFNTLIVNKLCHR